MDNHAIISAAFQKYYSALNSLNEFGCQGDFFDDVSSLDKFFSEFRNITFVIQKFLETDDNKSIYEELKQKYLMTDTLKWFVKVRNETTKQKPFNLTKELVIDIYLPSKQVYTIKDDRLVVDIEESFNDALDFIHSIFINELKMTEVYFTSTIVFREAGKNVDLYPKIKDGINQMEGFLQALCQKFDCNCDICSILKTRSNKIFKDLQSKDMKFVTDYALNDVLTPGVNAELYMSSDGNRYDAMPNIRASLDNPIYREVKDDLIKTFYKFISIHCVIFQIQQCRILPEFMIVYKDGTFRSIPFMVTVKSTFYRKVKEVVNLPDFSDVIAVFYCGEYFYYDKNQWQDIYDQAYEKRVLNAKKEYLGFTMISREQGELSVTFDENKINDMGYIRKQIHEARKASTDSMSSFDWLNPIRNKFEEVE